MTNRETTDYIEDLTCDYVPSYALLNAVCGQFKPSGLHLYDNALYNFFCEKLYNELLSIFIIDNIPENWNVEYFLNHLLCLGYCAVVDTTEFGWIPQNSHFTEKRDVYGFPYAVYIANNYYSGDATKEYMFKGNDVNCVLFRCNYINSAIVRIIPHYASKFAALFSIFDNSAMLSKNGFIVKGEHKASAYTLQKAVESILNGELIATILREKSKEPVESGKDIDVMESDVRKHYIITEVISDYEKLYQAFHKEIGVPIFIDKKERTNVFESRTANEAVRLQSTSWIETLNKCADKFNTLSGESIKFRHRFEGYEKEGDDFENALNQSI